MREVTQTQIETCLQSLSLQKGDGLLVHSAVQFLGRPVGGVGIYLDAILKVIGNKGTLAAPVFNFAFARGEAYDPQETPSEGMGVFSEYVRRQPGARRTSHPMQSLAVIGQHADDLAQRNTPSAFDLGSAYDRMLELDFKLLLLGAGILSVSMLHYSEQRITVPYRYWKDFPGRVHTTSGWEKRTYRMYVRDLDIDPHLALEPVQELLEARGQWSSEALNYGRVVTCRLVDFVAATDHVLENDPWALVTNKSL